MTDKNAFKTLEACRIIPVIALDLPQDTLPVADAVIAGGLPVIEITFRTAAAAEAIQTLTRQRPNLLVGAGTLLTVENLEKAVAAGAAFGVAPGLNVRVARRAAELGLPFIPGVATATEIEAALELGGKVLKFFPAGALGGLKALNALAAPFLHTGVRFVPTGGLNADNLADYLGAQSVLAVGGTWLATSEDIRQGAWAAVAGKCRQAVEIRDAR
jgi:2-dehydro-3-deoxyphosphogluconate aldolase/(4S)-4-hydroxy-2-oxoglutarate aldolase